MKKKDKILIVIGGPTAVGKTAIAIELATGFNTEIISADSRQIYRELTIGTAKPSLQELQQVRHHFIDSHSVLEDYDAAQFGRDALAAIETLFTTKQVVIMCGGSGLYIKAVCDGFDEMPEVPAQVRTDLMALYSKHGLSWLQEQMQAHDPEYFLALDQNNPQRLLRALEVRLTTGRSISTFQKGSKIARPFSIIKIGLELPHEILYNRINERMDKMIESGLFDEAKSLYPLRHRNALQTVGYKEIFDFMDGKYSYEEAIRLLKRNSRRYAKRQLTWFKADPDFHWCTPDAGAIRELLKGEME